jgi:hypothetical protein
LRIFSILPDTELATRQAVRVTADRHPGFPCRVSLRDARAGETLLLLNYEHLPVATPYRSRHAIYVRENAAEARLEVDEIPEVLRTRLLSLRSFDDAGMMIDADVVQGRDLAVCNRAHVRITQCSVPARPQRQARVFRGSGRTCASLGQVAPQCRRIHAEHPPKASAQAFRATEAARSSHLFDGTAVTGERAAGRLGAQTFDSFRRAHSRFCQKGPGKIARTHAGIFGQRRYAVPFTKIAAHMIQEAREAPMCALHPQQRRELRLSAGPAVVNH